MFVFDCKHENPNDRNVEHGKAGLQSRQNGTLPKIRGTILGVPIMVYWVYKGTHWIGVPIIRFMVYWGLKGGPLILGNHQIRRSLSRARLGHALSETAC